MGHDHVLGVMCECGVLAAPTRFYPRDAKGVEAPNAQGVAQRSYLEWVGESRLHAFYEGRVLYLPDLPEDYRRQVVATIGSPATFTGDKSLNGDNQVATNEMSPVAGGDKCPECNDRPKQPGRSMCAGCRRAKQRAGS